MTNTRTILIWFNNDEERIVLPVNPRSITITTPQEVLRLKTINGESLSLSCARGLMSAKISTFLPGVQSPFYQGTAPAAALSMLKRWQTSGRPVRVIISDSEINDAFLITSLSQTLNEGELDIGIDIELLEYRFTGIQSGSVVKRESGLLGRPDERAAVGSYTVKRGDTLWAISARLYGDGTRWREIAVKNGISDPKGLKIGQVLKL